MSTTATVTNIALASITPVLTTTFTPTSTSCTENRLTMLANRGFQIWMNMPVPVPGTTFSDCYPSQYMTSYLLNAGGVTQPAFDPLVCPVGWQTMGPYTSNYIACCPSGYSLANPTISVPTDRPAFSGTCYTDIPSGSSVRVTAYGSSGVTATISFTAPATTSAQAYAYPIDGYAFGVAAQKSDASTTAAVTQSSPSSSGSVASSTSAAGTTYTVFADAEPTFIPNSVAAKINDSIVFQFNSNTLHSATQSNFTDPCKQISNGFDSGYLINLGNTTATAPQSSFKLLTDSPQFFYSQASGDCGKGMVFVANPTSAESESAFQSKAISMYGPKSNAAKIGVGIAVPVVALLLVGLAFFFWRRNKQRKTAQHGEVANMEPHVYSAYNPQQEHNESELDIVKVPTGPPPPLPMHELHNYSTAYEMGGSSPNPYELQGSQEYGAKR